MADKQEMTAAQLRIEQARQDRVRGEEAIRKARKDAQDAAKNVPAEPDPDDPVIQTGKGLTNG